MEEIMKTLFITGSSGMLGSGIIPVLSGRFNLICQYNSNKPVGKGFKAVKIDIRDQEAAKKSILAHNPDAILHCAAATNVDWCEENKDGAFEINVAGTENIIRAGAGGCPIIYISTDSVFDGMRGNYSEGDAPKPINNYAHTKLLAEQRVLGGKKNLVLRTNIVGGRAAAGGKMNLSEWIVSTAKTKGEVGLFKDVLFNPLHVRDAGMVIEQCIERGLFGLYHVGSHGGLSKLEFGRQLLAGLSINARINEITLADKKMAAPRPLNTTLSLKKIEGEGIKMPSMDDCLNKTIGDFDEKS